MRKRSFIFVGILLSVAHFSVLTKAQVSCTKAQTLALSESGAKAYESLEKETLFALGGIGYSGETSSGEQAMRVLLAESSAEAAFFNLSTSDAGAGGLYGLIGLKILKSNCFSEAYKTFSELPDKGKTKGRHETLEAGEVGYMSGCIYSIHGRTEIAKTISDGKLDMWIEAIQDRRSRH